MNIIRALLMVLSCLTLGEATVWILGLKLSNSAVDMGLLLVAFQAGWVKLSWAEELADILMASPALFLVLPCIAAISYLNVIANDWFSILMATIISMVCVFLVTSKVHEWVRRLM